MVFRNIVTHKNPHKVPKVPQMYTIIHFLINILPLYIWPWTSLIRDALAGLGASVGSFEDIHNERACSCRFDKFVHAQFLIIVGIQLTHDGSRVRHCLLLEVWTRTRTIDRLHTKDKAYTYKCQLYFHFRQSNDDSNSYRLQDLLDKVRVTR